MAQTQSKKKPATAESVLSSLRESLEELRDTALSEIERAKQEAEERERQYHHKRGKLDSARTHLAELEDEHSRLPLESHQQRMRGEVEAEERLNERYRSIEEEMPALREQITRLSTELDRELTGSLRVAPAAGAAVVAHREALRTAAAKAEELSTLREEITGLLELLDPVEREHQVLRGFVSEQGQRAEQAFNRGGYRTAADVPGH